MSTIEQSYIVTISRNLNQYSEPWETITERHIENHTQVFPSVSVRIGKSYAQVYMRWSAGAVLHFNLENSLQLASAIVAEIRDTDAGRLVVDHVFRRLASYVQEYPGELSLLFAALIRHGVSHGKQLKQDEFCRVLGIQTQAGT